MTDSAHSESTIAKENLYKFYEAQDDDKEEETFCVQCEWYNKSIDLNADSSENEEYCLLTITDLTDYWQITVDRELLLQKFKPSNALNTNVRSEVLTLALQGIEKIRGQRVSWAIVAGDKLKMKLKTYYDVDLPGIAGSFFVEKAPVNRKKELNKLWYKNSAIASRTATVTEEAKQLLIDNLEKSGKELAETMKSMTSETIEYKFSIFSSFTRILNAKKDKISALIRDLEKANRKIEKLNKRSRNEMEKKDGEEDEEEEVKEEENDRRPKKAQKISVISSTKSNSRSSQPSVSVKDEPNEQSTSSKSRPTASAPVKSNESSSDHDSDEEDLFILERTL